MRPFTRTILRVLSVSALVAGAAAAAVPTALASEDPPAPCPSFVAEHIVLADFKGTITAYNGHFVAKVGPRCLYDAEQMCTTRSEHRCWDASGGSVRFAIHEDHLN